MPGKIFVCETHVGEDVSLAKTKNMIAKSTHSNHQLDKTGIIAKSPSYSSPKEEVSRGYSENARVLRSHP